MKKNKLVWNINSLRDEETKYHLYLKPEDLDIKNNFINNTIECAVVLRKLGSKISLQGEISFSLVLRCSRCFENFSLEKKETLSTYYIARETSFNTEKEDLSQIDILTEYYDNETIDLSQLLYDTVNLSIPIKPLCKDDCRGLCPICGSDLNTKSCSCKRDKIDTRWEPLKKLLKNK